MNSYQHHLFDPQHDPHLARRTDPETSYKAADSVNVAANELFALNLLIQHDGSTAGELEALAKECTESIGNVYREGRVRKRLAGLRQKGRLRNGPARKCRALGSQQLTWFVQH